MFATTPTATVAAASFLTFMTYLQAGPHAREAASVSRPPEPGVRVFASRRSAVLDSTGLMGTTFGRQNQALFGGARAPSRLLPDDLDQDARSEEHTSELQSRLHTLCPLFLL